MTLRVLMVVGRFPQTSETFLVRKAIALASRGHKVTVATRRPGNWDDYKDCFPLPPNLSVAPLVPEHGFRRLENWTAVARNLGALAELVPAISLWKKSCDLRRFLLHVPLLRFRGHVDVVHFEFLGLGGMYDLVREALPGIPVVVSCRGADLHFLEEHSPTERASRIGALRDADAIHCVSREMADEVARLSGRMTDLVVNRPAIPLDRIPSRSVRVRSEVPRFVTVGRLAWKKGYDYLLAAFAQLKSAGVRFRAEIIGDGPLRAPLRFGIEDMGLAKEVELVGALQPAEVLRRLGEADVFVLSSVEEGISNAVLEAMATGIPVITTSAGGMAEAVTDGVQGYVVAPRDIAALARRMEELATNPRLRLKMGAAARARIEHDFSLERQARVFEELYLGLVGKRHREAAVDVAEDRDVHAGNAEVRTGGAESEVDGRSSAGKSGQPGALADGPNRD